MPRRPPAGAAPLRPCLAPPLASPLAPLLAPLLALLLILASLFVLERARKGVTISPMQVGQTPVTRYAQTGAQGPVVVLAHGFAGSPQMMQGYALPLARAGYRVFAYEFLGHGRHPVPMSGDVTSVDGTTRLLVAQTHAVIDAVDDLAGGASVALIGHSMATDILVRSASTRDDIGPMVLISAFSQEITATAPQSLLLVTGAWEAGLGAFALEAVQSIDPKLGVGEIARAGEITRRAIAAPYSEHISVLQSRVARRAALDWLDRAYGRASQQTLLPTGWAILGLLGGLVFLCQSLLHRFPVHPTTAARLSRKRFATVLLLPAALTPLIAVPLNPGVLPVLVADYLGLHLLIFGGGQLCLLWLLGAEVSRPSARAMAGLLLFCALFGLALDRYAANFWPTPQRLWIIAAMLIGAVPYMLADAMLTAQASPLRRFAVRLCFLLSLAVAVALDVENLLFLIMIAPVLVLFYLIFGTIGRSVARRSSPTSAGLALGVVLAWSLGVSFPLFQG